jgi:ABC-type sugar transport system ATPase subunit
MTEAAMVEFRELEKEFSGTKVLKGVSLTFTRGEVHGLLGENGAGKSTLIKILTGVYSASGGTILLEGKPARISSPLDAHRLGIGAVYQDAELVSGFSVGANVLLGNEPGSFAVSQRRINERARAILAEIGVSLDVDRRASSLSAAEMQLVTLATLFQRRYKVIILDEPTARLSATEVELLFRIVQRFREQGITIIYISHRLGEVKAVCDRVTILRGGRVSAMLTRDEITEERVTELMVDHSSSSRLETYNQGHATDRVVLDVEALATEHLQPISFSLRAGEVVGITGPIGGGKEEIQKALGGVARHSGRISIDGRVAHIASPSAARAAGIAVIPEDRRKQALFPNLSIADNLALPMLNVLSRAGLIDRKRKLAYADGVMARFSVNPPQADKAIKFFSGGNQQKAVIGKWMTAEAKVYIFVEPTSGVDVGAIKEIYDIILHLARQGAAVIVISSMIREILALAETVYVVHDERLVYRAPKRDCTHDQLLAISMQGRSRLAAA